MEKQSELSIAEMSTHKSNSHDYENVYVSEAKKMLGEWVGKTGKLTGVKIDVDQVLLHKKVFVYRCERHHNPEFPFILTSDELKEYFIKVVN